MRRRQPAQIKAPEITARLARDLPASDRQVCRDLMAALTLPDRTTALAEVPDPELLDLLRTTPFKTEVIRSLQKLGVSCPQGRLPRNAGIIRMRLRPALTTPNGTGQILLLQATDPVMTRLIAVAAGLELDSPVELERLDTPALRGLTVAFTASIDPSLPLVLLGLSRHDHPFAKELIPVEQQGVLAQFAEQISEEGWAYFESWATERTGLVDPNQQAPTHNCQAPGPATVEAAAHVDHSSEETTGPDRQIADAPGEQVPARPARKRPARVQSADSTPPPQPPVATTQHAPGTPTADTSATTISGDRTGLRARLEQLPKALAGARAAHERLAHALTTGTRPDRADLSTLQDGVTHLQAVHDEAAAVLASNGTETAAELLVLLERADRSRTLMLDLAAASSTTGGLEESLSALRTTVNGLLDRWPPTRQQDLDLAEALTGLHALINEAASPLADDDDLFDRAQHLLAALPGDLRKVVTAANRGKLTLGDAAARPAGAPGPAAKLATAARATDDAPAAPSPAPPTATSVTTQPTPHGAGDGDSAGAAIAEPSAAPAQTAPPARPPAQNKHEQPVPVAGLAPAERAAPASTSGHGHASASLSPDTPTVSLTTGRAAAATRASAPVEGRADAPPVTTTADSSAAPAKEAHDDVLRVVGDLLQRGRLGLAYHLLEDAEHGNSSFVIMLAALARRLRTKTGPCALELVENSELADNDVLTSDSSELLAAAALVKAALVTGNTHLAQLIHDLLEHLPTAWARLARLTSEAVSSGALTDTGIHETADPSALEQATTETATVAQRRLSSQPKLREHRAQTLLTRLRAPSTDLGAALAVAARNDASGLTAVQQVTADLTRSQIHGHVLAEDQKLRQGGKALPAERIEEITEILLTDRDTVARWASAVARANARITDDSRDWGHGRLLALHEHITQHHADLQAELNAHAATGPLGRGQSAAAAALLADVDAIVHGQPGPPEVEPSVLHVLHMELLKLVGATLDVERGIVALPDMEPADRLAALMNAAAEDSWEPAMRRHLDNDDYDAALRCAQEVDRSETGDHVTSDPDATDPATESPHAAGAGPDLGTVRSSHVALVHEARPRRLQQLKTEAGALRMLLVQARRGEDQSVQDTVDASLGELELLLDTPDVDLRRVRDELRALEQTAGQLRDATCSSLIERLDSLEPVVIDDADRERLRQQIAAGDYVAVDDEITNRQLNKRLPVYGSPADLLAFFPHVPAGLPDGISNRVLETIRGHGTVAGLDFAADPGRAGAIADLLAQWRDVGNQMRPGGSGWHRETSRNLLVPVLVAVGLQAPSSSLITLDTPGTHGKGWRFVELRDATRIGKAMVPAFGSQANRRYRLLLAYDVPDVRTLSALRDSDGSDSPLVICYFGTLSPDQRMELARDWADPTMRPTIVLDDAALAYVLHARAERSGSLFATLMNVALPFTTTSPFSDIKSEDVPVEMFYGRDREKRRIEAMAGESLLYGGRNLGKSALLRTIKKAADSGNGERKVVMLQLPRDEAFGAASELWGELVEALEREGFTAGSGMSRAKPQARVERMIENWLAKNSHSQLLIMLDEVDGFFNADAQVSFHETTRLFQLKERNNRLKIVFAGLHSVNHFHGTGNVPFSPAGALAIGPLDPADAYRLLTGPMHAMGYAIEPDEARRIMMHCNYQPYLIQMFAHRLLEQLHLQRPNVTTPPPWTVTSMQVQRVMHDPNMRSKISRAFTMTLELDKRFQVIVNLLALHAYDGKGTPLSGRELYDDCRQQWPEGFAETSMASFLELLNELEGLGVVGPQDARGGRPLRSSALLPSLGSRSEIEHNLAAVADLGLTENQARGLMRPALDDKGRPGPLTTDQLATVAGRVGNRTHVLIGSAALGLPQVEEALTGRQPAMRKIVIAPNIGAFRKLLKTGGTGETRMTVVSELWRKRPEADTCQESLENARSDEYTPEERNAHRAAVLIAGTENGAWLEHYLCDDPLRDSDVVPMERFSARSLPLQWRDRPKLEELGSPELAPRLLEVTGGWPALVDQVVQRTLKANAQTALDEAEQRLAQPSWPAHFLQATGAIGASEELTRLVGALVEHGDPADDDDVALLTMTHGITDLDRAVTLAEWFSLVDRDRDGRLCLAPLIARAWDNHATTT
jgi:hypothetical protein